MTYNQLVRILTEVKNNMSSIMYLDRFGTQVSIGFSVIDLVKSVVDYATTASTVTTASVVFEYTEYHFDLNSEGIKNLRASFDGTDEEFKTYFIEGFKYLMSQFYVTTETADDGSWIQYQDFYKTLQDTEMLQKILKLALDDNDDQTEDKLTEDQINKFKENLNDISKNQYYGHSLQYEDNVFTIYQQLLFKALTKEGNPVLDSYNTPYNDEENSLVAFNKNGMLYNNHYWYYNLYKLQENRYGDWTDISAERCRTCTFYGVTQGSVAYEELQSVINNNKVGTIITESSSEFLQNLVVQNKDDNVITINVLSRVAYGNAPMNEGSVSNNYSRTSLTGKFYNDQIENVIDLSSHTETSLRDKTMNISDAYNNQSLLYYLMNSELNAFIYADQLDNSLYIKNLEDYIAKYDSKDRLATQSFKKKNIKGDGLLDALAKLLGIKKLEAVDFQTKLTTYVLSAYELLNCDLSANYNDLIITNIDLKEQVQLGNLKDDIETTNLANKITHWLNQLTNSDLDIVSSEIKYDGSRDEAPVGYYFVNNVSSDYSYQKQTTSLQTHKITSEEFSAYYQLSNSDLTKNDTTLSNNAFISAMYSAQQYFYPYLSNSSARGANYVSPNTNYLQSINAKTNYKDFSQNNEDTYSLKVCSYVAVNDKVINTDGNPLIDFNNSNGISTLSNDITIGAEGQSSSYNEDIKDRSIIRRIGLAIDNKTLLTTSEYKKLSIITGISLAIGTVLIIVGLVVTISSAGTATGPVLGATFKILTVIGNIASLLKLFTVAIKTAIIAVRVIILALPTLLKLLAIASVVGIIYTSVTNSIISNAWQNSQNFGKVTAPQLITNADPNAYTNF